MYGLATIQCRVLQMMTDRQITDSQHIMPKIRPEVVGQKST